MHARAGQGRAGQGRAGQGRGWLGLTSTRTAGPAVLCSALGICTEGGCLARAAWRLSKASCGCASLLLRLQVTCWQEAGGRGQHLTSAPPGSPRRARSRHGTFPAVSGSEQHTYACRWSEALVCSMQLAGQRARRPHCTHHHMTRRRARITRHSRCMCMSQQGLPTPAAYQAAARVQHAADR